MSNAGDHSKQPLLSSTQSALLVETAEGLAQMEAELASKNASLRVHVYRDEAWIVCEAIHLACLALTLYLLYALFHHRALETERRHKTTARHRKGGKWLENLCIIGLFAAMLRFANNQILLFTGWWSPGRCSVLLNVSIAMYFIAIHPVYIFLWVRQRIFYSNRALKHLYSKTVRFLSWVMLACFVLTTILSMVIFVVDPHNSATGRVCRDSYMLNGTILVGEVTITETLTQEVKVNTIAGLLAGGIQLSFLALFLYPIMDNKLRAMRSQHMRSGSVALITLIRRSFILAGVCIVSDVVIAILVKTIHVQFPDSLFAPLAMYDVNLMINLICIIVTFRRWREMLFPWCSSRVCASILPYCRICPSLMYRRSTKKYCLSSETRSGGQVTSSGKARAPHFARIEEDHQSHRKRTRSRRRPRRSEPVFPLDNVMLPIVEQIEHSCPVEMPKTDSLGTNDSGFPDQQNNSEGACELQSKNFQRKRSMSLILTHTIAPEAFKRTKSFIASSLMTKSKLWLKDRNDLSLA